MNPHSSRSSSLVVAALSLVLAAGLAKPAGAAKYDITIPGTTAYLQSQFHDLSEQIGLAIAYRALAPAEPLGLLGFDVGVEITAVKIDKNESFWTAVNPDLPSYLGFPKLHAQKGLPFGFDVGLVYTKLPASNIGMFGGELKWAILKGTLATPALALRGSYTTLTGVETLNVSTYGADVSISKGIGPITPYAGIGEVWINSSTSVVPPSGALADEAISATRAFVGAKLSLLLLSFAAEADFSKVPSYSFRIGLSF